MFYLLSPTASVLMGLFVAGYAALTGAKSAAKALLSSSDCGDCHYEKPFLELSVQPVSEGDQRGGLDGISRHAASQSSRASTASPPS